MSEIVVLDREHARISPSGFSRVEACTMSVRLSAHVSPEAPGIDALVGTAAHAVLERCLVLNLDTFELGDLKHVQVDGHTIEIDGAMLDGVQLALDVVRTSGLFKGRLIAIEKIIHLDFAEQYLGQPMYGYADVSAVGLPAIVLDYKNGFNPVEADAPQLGLYVLGEVLEHVPELDKDGHAGTAIIVQPNVNDGRVKVHDWTYAALRDLRDRVIITLKRIKRADFTYSYGAHCRWCPAAGVCPHLAAVARDFALAKVAPTPEMVATGELTAAQLDEWYTTLQVLNVWTKRFMDTFQDYLTHGGYSEVAKLVHKRTVRRWIDEEKVPEQLKAIGITPWQEKLISPAEAERRLPKAKQHLIKPLTEKPIGELTLADKDDPREAVNIRASLKAALASSVAAGYLERKRP